MDAEMCQGVMTIRAEADPLVAMRVLGLIAVDNSVPSCFSARQMPDGGLQMILELAGCTGRRIEYLGRKIENIPTVLSVEIALAAPGPSESSCA